MKSVIKILTIIFTCVNIVSCELQSTPQITMNPINDAQTCIKLYKEDAIKGEEYMQDVITTYYMQGMHSEHDKFSSIVTTEIAKMQF